MTISDSSQTKQSAVEQSQAEWRKAYDAEYRRKRKVAKNNLVEKYEAGLAKLIKKEKYDKSYTLGFGAFRINRSGGYSKLPPEFGPILKACEEFIDNPRRFPALHALGGTAINNRQCRVLIARVLAVILPRTDLIGGRIGETTKANFNPISYDYLQEDFVLRWGKAISPSSFDKAIKYLRVAGYITIEQIKVGVDEASGIVRSGAAYKQFTEAFFSDLKVVRYENIALMILATRARYENLGYSFKWAHFRTIAKKVKEIYNTYGLEKMAYETKELFLRQGAPAPHASPH